MTRVFQDGPRIIAKLVEWALEVEFCIGLQGVWLLKSRNKK